MNQYSSNDLSLPPGNHQQAQWQQQQQQPISDLQQPQPQYASMPMEDAAMPMHPPTQATPTLDAMYSQGQQHYGQPRPPSSQQSFSQHPNAFQGNEHMSQFSQFPQQPHQMNPSMPVNQGVYGGTATQGQQYPYHDLSTTQEQAEKSQGAFPGFDPAATAWEQKHVKEVNDERPMNTFPQPAGSQAPQYSTQAAREAELSLARQRVQALQDERERQDTAKALVISAREAPYDEEQYQQQLHQAQLLSLNAWEDDLRRQIEQQQYAEQSNVAYDDSYASVSSSVPQQQQPFNYPDPRRGSPPYSPAPTLQNRNAAQQRQLHPPANHAAPSQAASASRTYHPKITIPNTPPIPQHHPYAAPPAQNDTNFPWTPPTLTPTPGVPPEQAARNLPAEEARRWETSNRNWARQQDGARSATVTPALSSEYTLRSAYSPSVSDASTVRGGGGGSKGKGRGRML